MMDASLGMTRRNDIREGSGSGGENAKLADCDMAISDKNYLKGYEVGLY